MKNIKRISLAVFCSALSVFALACGGDTATYYNVTFTQNGYEDVVVKVKEGTALAENKIPATQAKEGYTVTWEEKDFSAVTDNLTVNAVETANNYTVTYDTNGGTLETTTQTVTYDASYTLATPEKEDYSFAGWYLGETLFAPTGTWKTAKDVTLVASWTENPIYTITFVVEGQQSIVKQVKQGKDLPTEEIPALGEKTGYTLAWSVTDFTNVTADITVTVVEIPNEYKIYYNTNGGTMESNVQTVVYNQAYTLLDVTKAGYIFKGWYVVGSDGNATGSVFEAGTWTALEDVTIIALWEEDLSSNGGYTDRL